MDPNGMHLDAYRRALRAKRRSDRTIQGYEEAIGLLAAHYPGVDLAELAKGQVEEFLTDLQNRPGRKGERMSSSSIAIRYRALRAFYNWMVDEEIVEVSPMAKMDPPKVTETPVPVVPDDALRRLLKMCEGRGFEQRRDAAIIRLFCEPGSPRVAEMAGLTVEDLDLRHDVIRLHGKGDKVRAIPFGAKTGQALDRYLRERSKHRDAKTQWLWLGARQLKPLSPSGIYQMVERRCVAAGLPRIHPHQLRHTAAHVWFDQGGSEGDAMSLFGWSTPEMTRRYGQSARVERATRAARKMSPADRL